MSRTTMRGWIAMAAVWMVAQGWVGASDWPQWRGPNRDGVSAETVTISAWPPVLVWSNTIAAGESAVVVSGCFAYTMGREGGNNYVYCFDTATGSNVWTQSYTADAGSGSYGPQATPTVFSNEVYTFDDAGKLYCFDKVTGAPLWNATVPGVKPQYGYSGSPLVEGNQVLLMASAAGLAVNRTTHAVAWPGTSEAGTSYASPVAMTVSGTRMLLFLSDSALNAVSTNGTLLWSYANDSGMISGYAAADPVVSGDKILLYENGLVLLQATPSSVSEVWALNTDATGASFLTPVIVGNYAYAISSGGDLVRISLADGTVDWNMAISDGKGALVYVDGKLIVLANGKLRVVKIGAVGFDEEGREPLVVRAAWDPDYAWTPPALSAGKVYCRIKNNLACYSLSGLESGASLAMDTNDLRVVCPIGTVVTQEVTIANAGDQPLTWTLTDGFEGTNFVKIARQFKVNWSSSPTMLRYDETRDCLWASCFFGSVVAQISVTDGSLLGTKSMGTNVVTMCAIDIEGGNLWGQHSSQAKMVKFNLNDMSVLTRVSYPSGWWRMEAMARGDGNLYAYSWWQGGEGLIYRLNPATGATLASYPIPDSFSYTDNRHFGYADGAVWWGARTTTPYNRLVKWDPVTGKVRARFTVEGWQTGVTVNDVTSSATNTQVWALTSTHQVGLNERWAHLVDLSGARRLTESASGGTIGAGGSVALKLTFNGVGASSAFWPVRLRVESDGGNAEKLVTFVTHAPGANHAPTANAGPDQVMEATSTSAVTQVTLNGSGSSDPDADALKYTWTEGGATVYVGENPMPTVNLGPGVHDLTLTVDDYRGGTATDTMRITLNAPDIAFDPDPYILCPQGSVATGSVRVLNLGTRTLNWTVNQTNAWVNISPLSGSIAASSSAQIQMVVDRRSAALGRYPVQLVFSSNDPDEGTVANVVSIIVHAPGPNHPPVAHPRTNGTVYADCTGAIVLYDAGSTDPDGDDLRYMWLENGTNVGSGTSCIVERGFGTHTFTLTVDDYRGMTNTADVQITVTNRVLKDWEAWYGTDGSGWIAASNGWVENWPPVVVWRQPQQMGGGGYSGQSCPVISEGRVYYTGYFGAFCMDLATGVVLWRDASFQGGNGTPAVDEGRVYGSSKWGDLSACWNKFTGARLWSASLNERTDEADGAGACWSPSVHGDIALFRKVAVNKYTGAVVWEINEGTGSNIAKSHRWNGRTYLAMGYNEFLVDMRTGFPVLRDIGGSYGAAAGTVFYGENMTWDVRQMKPLGGGLPENIAGASEWESFQQPIVVGDYGYYMQGGHGCGGCMAAVNLKEKRQVWRSLRGWDTWIAAGDKVIAQGNREVALIKAGVNSYVEEYPPFRYDPVGGAGFTIPAYADQKIVLGGGLGMTCLSVAYSVPVVNNGSGVRWDETAGTATLNGNLVNTGGKPATVYVYWGRTDGGTNKAAWERCENLGVRTAGPFSTVVTPLRDTVYYYRCYATNSVGGAWATGNMGIYNLEPSQRFNTYTSGSSVNDGTLLLHWPCEEINGTTVADVSGNGNHGTVSGSSYIRPGVVGNAMWCDADRNAGRWIGLSSPTLNETLNGDFSMSYWLNIQTYYGDANPPRDFLGWSPGGLSMGLRSGCKLHFGGQLWPGVLSTGSWYHVAFTRTGSNHVMYVDGAQGTPGFSGVVLPYTSFGFSIDRSLLIDDLRVYRKALSLDEIRQLGAMGCATNAGSAATGVMTTVAGALTYAWTFGDGSSGAGANVSHTYGAPGSYLATLTVSDGNGGVATTNVTISGTGAVSVVSAAGGTVTNYVENGTWYRAHIFTNSGTLAVATGGLVEVYAWGGGGGGSQTSGSGGGGGATRGIAALASGSYFVVVGGGGQCRNYPSPGGPGDPVPGGGGLAAQLGGSGQGGGYSGLFSNVCIQANALAIAGGGGGGGYAGTGGAGGGTNGIGGGGPNSGGGGTQSAGGAGGNGTSGPGSALQGGTAGTDGDGGGGGGGGGGYYGGGAGYNGDSPAGNSGGGGGSGYYNPTFVSSATLTAGSGATPGDSSNPFRGSAGNGGAQNNAGNSGLVIVRYIVGYSQQNRAPVAHDRTVTTRRNVARTIALTGTDPDGDTLTFAIATPPAHGTLSGAAPNVTYTPASVYTGADAFTFKVNDGATDSPPATVSIAVMAPETVPPVISGFSATPTNGAIPLTVAFAATASGIVGSDDAEEEANGAVNVADATLALGRSDASGNKQTVGLRFPNVAIPRGATILNASIQFKAAGSGSDETRLVIRGEAADNAAAYAGTAFNVSARTYTVSAVEWTPPAWTAGAAGVAQRTPDLAGVLQEMVTRPGWTGNSALAFGIVGTPSSTGQVGQRIADAIEKPGGAAAVLRVVWRLDPEPLRVEYASSVGNPNRVEVKFDRQVSEATAETVGNYRLSGGVEVSGAELVAEGDWVRLTVSGMTTGRVYRLTVNGVKDLSVPVQYVAMEAEAVFTCMGCPVQFIRKDTTTQGTWKGMYGQDGQAIYWVSATYPTYVTVSGGPDMNSICIWSGSTSDVRGLQRPGGSDRVATAWHDRFGPLNLDVNLTDGKTHQVALYYVDWDLQNRCEKVEVIEYGSGRIWDTQILGTNTFTNGVYLVWNMSGHQIIRTTNLAPGKNAVMSGVFFDPAAVLPGPDEDHDGVEDVWEVLHYGNTSKTLAWLQATDSDKDGMMDWEEYVAGTRPLDQWSYLALTDAGLGQSGLVVRWTSETNHVYDLWRSTNLTAGFDLRIGTNLAATLPMNVYTDLNATCNCLFYRVEVK